MRSEYNTMPGLVAVTTMHNMILGCIRWMLRPHSCMLQLIMKCKPVGFGVNLDKGEKLVRKLIKSCYDLKYPGRNWNKMLDNSLSVKDFMQNPADLQQTNGKRNSNTHNYDFFF